MRLRNSLSRRKVQPQHTDHWQDKKGVDEFHPASPMIDRLMSLLDEPVAVQQESIVPIIIQREESKAIDHQQQQQDRCNRDEHRVLTPDEINDIVDSLLSLLNKPVHRIL